MYTQEARNPSFYQPGKGNILSYFCQGELTPSHTKSSSLIRDVEDAADLEGGGGGGVGADISNLANYLFSPSPAPKQSSRRSSIFLGGGGKASSSTVTNLFAPTPEKQSIEQLLSPLPASPLVADRVSSSPVRPCNLLNPDPPSTPADDRAKEGGERKPPQASSSSSPSSPSFIFKAAQEDKVSQARSTWT